MVLNTTLDMNQSDRNVRILLVGERGVGKTSMIYSLVFEEFYEQVPPKCEEITIPPEVTPVHIPTEIVDYSAQEQTEKELMEEMRKASVICIVYSVENEISIDKISSYWLPYIHQTLGEDHETPVILVGNKADLVDYSSIDSVLPLMNQYKEIEICVECSAKKLDNLSEIFYYAQKTVLYPVTPIYYPEERDLSESCKIALKRVFKLCDLDNDGVLNDFELNQFQTFCFGSFLLSQTLDEVKYILKSIIPDGVYENGITLSGFMFLLTFFIQRGRHELIWIVLRKFGYNNAVAFNDDYLYPEITVPNGSTVELSPKGYSFFTNLFEKYDKDKDGALSPDELNALFSICDSPPKWHQADCAQIVHTNEKGWITLQGFLSMWALTTSIELKETLRYLALFGYMATSGEKNQISALYVTKDKRIDLSEKQTSRNVFFCRLIGPKGAGKSSFMRKFIGKHSLNNGNKGESVYNNYVVNSIMIYGQKKYLINNFQKTKLPILFVASKSDLPVVKQNYRLQPEDFCSYHKLTPLHKFSAVTNKESNINLEVYEKLATMAAYPNLNRLVHLLLMKPTNSWMAQNMNLIQRCLPQDRVALLQAGIGFASLALLGLFILRFLRSNSSSS
ncbi:Mitochondrial Rho GTPase 2 [Blomia tropicalis]|nr:Mitochondrial Rho GTPase 2 [Blomia tropicalis]